MSSLRFEPGDVNVLALRELPPAELLASIEECTVTVPELTIAPPPLLAVLPPKALAVIFVDPFVTQSQVSASHAEVSQEIKMLHPDVYIRAAKLAESTLISYTHRAAPAGAQGEIWARIGREQPEMASALARLRGVPRDTLLFLAYMFCSNIAMGTFTLVFNLYLLELSFKEDFIGLASAVQTGAMAVTAFALGGLLGRWGVWRVVLISLVCFVVVSTALSLATTGYLILILILIWGAVSSFVFSTVMPFVVELSDERGRQRIASLAVSASMAATMLGSLIGGWMPRIVATLMEVERASVPAFRGALFAGIVVAALGVIPLLLMSGERRKPMVDDDDEDERVLRPGLPQATTSVQRQRLMVFVLIGGIMSIGAGMTQPFFNVYLLSIGAAPGQIGLIFAGASIFAAVTTLFSPRLVDWFGSERAVAFGRSSPVPFYILLVLAPGLGVAALAHVVRTASQGLGWSVESAYMSMALRGRARRAVFGYRSGTWNVGYAITSLIGGVIIVRWGYNPTFIVYAVSMATAMALFYVYARYISPIDPPQDASVVAEPAPGVPDEPALRRDARV